MSTPNSLVDRPPRAPRPAAPTSPSPSPGAGAGAGPARSPWRPRHNPWAVALTVTMATFMEVLDTSIANVALPHIAGGLSASQDEATWVLTSYLVANAVVLPISAWVSDRVGRKKFYMFCVALFTLSSFLCGAAPSLGLLIFFRVIQGIGGGGLGPSEQAILADTFPPAKRGMAFAVYGMAVVMAPAIGPTLGGYITEHYNWHWIFFINVPVGIASLFLTNIMVEDPPHVVATRARARRASVDYVGMALVALGLGSMEVVLDKGQEDNWFSSPFILGFTVTAVVCGLFFVVWEWHQEHPILDLKLLRNRAFGISVLLMTVLGVSLNATTLLMPQYLQTVLGWTAEKAGEVLSPGGFAMLFCMPAVGVLTSKSDPRRLIAFGFLVCGLALLHATQINEGIDFRTATWYRVYQMLGLAFLFVPINTISYVGMPPEKGTQVSGMINLARNLGGSIGIAAASSALQQLSQVHQSYLVPHLAAGDPLFTARVNAYAAQFVRAGSGAGDATQKAYGQVYQVIQSQATTLSYIDVFSFLAVLCLLVVPLAFLTQRPKPGEAPAGH